MRQPDPGSPTVDELPISSGEVIPEGYVITNTHEVSVHAVV